MKDYEKIHALSRHAQVLHGITSILSWDQETYMPPGAANCRSDQLKTMAGIIHREKTSKKFSNALGKLIDLKSGKISNKSLSAEQKAALTEWRKDYQHDTALPDKFVEEYTKLTSQALMAWHSAKAENAYQQFAPYLDRIIDMNRKKADLLGYQDHPYDALLNEHEPGMTTQEVTKLFTQVRDFISPLLKKIKPIDDSFLFGEWEHSKQMTFSHKILDAMGYDMNHGRVDFSSHPFSSASHPTDSRITTRIHPRSLMSNIMAILHEGGHALYEMGLPQEQFGSPLGQFRSMGIHESQSRWWETCIGLSQPFWRHYFPILQETFHHQLGKIKFDQFYQAINKVKPSLIRVEADEVTYPLHVILRFEIEKSLIEGTLNVREIPEAWNAKMKDYLGIVPETNAQGCLQDIHWSFGAFGYFPTYTLGNLYAAHLFEAFEKKHPEWEKQVEKGEFKFIKDWLNDKIYRHGRRYSVHELLFNATGQEFSAKPYLRYIEHKYST